MKCDSKCGSFDCNLEKGHEKYHTGGCGISWEDSIMHPDADIKYIVSEGSVSGSVSLCLQVTLPDGRVFYKSRDYLDELKTKTCKCDVWAGGCKCGGE
jgi:hypothetical protein